MPSGRRRGGSQRCGSPGAASMRLSVPLCPRAMQGTAPPSPPWGGSLLPMSPTLLVVETHASDTREHLLLSLPTPDPTQPRSFSLAAPAQPTPKNLCPPPRLRRGGKMSPLPCPRRPLRAAPLERAVLTSAHLRSVPIHSLPEKQVVVQLGPILQLSPVNRQDRQWRTEQGLSRQRLCGRASGAARHRFAGRLDRWNKRQLC